MRADRCFASDSRLGVISCAVGGLRVGELREPRDALSSAVFQDVEAAPELTADEIHVTVAVPVYRRDVGRLAVLERVSERVEELC